MAAKNSIIGPLRVILDEVELCGYLTKMGQKRGRFAPEYADARALRNRVTSHMLSDRLFCTAMS